MVAAVAGFIGAAIQVVKWIGAPIKLQFTYLCCFTSNITTLRNEAEKLEVKAEDLQGKVDRARDDVRVISREVEVWLKNSKDIKDETDGILNEVPAIESGCLKFGARFSLSKRANKTTDRMKELREQCKFDAEAISQLRHTFRFYSQQWRMLANTGPKHTHGGSKWVRRDTKNARTLGRIF